MSYFLQLADIEKKAAAQGWIDNAWNSVRDNVVSPVWNGVAHYGSNAGAALGGVAQAAGEVVASPWRSLAGAVNGAINSNGTLGGFVQGAMDGGWNGRQDSFNRLRQAGNYVGGAIGNISTGESRYNQPTTPAQPQQPATQMAQQQQPTPTPMTQPQIQTPQTPIYAQQPFNPWMGKSAFAALGETTKEARVAKFLQKGLGWAGNKLYNSGTAAAKAFESGADNVATAGLRRRTLSDTLARGVSSLDDAALAKRIDQGVARVGGAAAGTGLGMGVYYTGKNNGMQEGVGKGYDLGAEAAVDEAAAAQGDNGLLSRIAGVFTGGNQPNAGQLYGRLADRRSADLQRILNS